MERRLSRLGQRGGLARLGDNRGSWDSWDRNGASGGRHCQLSQRGLTKVWMGW